MYWSKFNINNIYIWLFSRNLQVKAILSLCLVSVLYCIWNHKVSKHRASVVKALYINIYIFLFVSEYPPPWAPRWSALCAKTALTLCPTALEPTTWVCRNGRTRVPCRRSASDVASVLSGKVTLATSCASCVGGEGTTSPCVVQIGSGWTMPSRGGGFQSIRRRKWRPRQRRTYKRTLRREGNVWKISDSVINMTLNCIVFFVITLFDVRCYLKINFGFIKGFFVFFLFL